MKASSDVIAAVFITFLVSATLFAVTPSRSGSLFDPRYDVDHNGIVDMLDLFHVAQKYGTSGSPMIETAMLFNSGWLNISGENGQNITVVHGLDLDMNDENIVIDITGKTILDSQTLLRYIGSVGNLGESAGWMKTYGGLTYDEAHFTLVQTADGGYALAGETFGGPGGVDMWLVKTDSDGKMEWNKYYGGGWDEKCYCMTQTADGGFALAGYKTMPVEGLDFWLVKTDDNGNEEWNKTYCIGENTSEIAHGIIQAADGGFVLTGISSGGDFYAARTDVVGNMEWELIFNGTYTDYGYSVVQASDGGYVFAGFTGSYSGGNEDAWLMKTDPIGAVEWNKTYGDSGYDAARTIVRTDDGGYVFAGSTSSWGAGSSDFWLVKVDENGNQEWDKTYGGTGSENGWDIVGTSDGGYALTGWTSSFGAGGYDFWLVRTDESGEMEWSRAYGGTGYDEARSLVQTSDGGYAIAGRSGSFGAGATDFLLVKTDAEGRDGLVNVEAGLVWIGGTPDSVILYRGAFDTDWNYVRVRVFQVSENP